MRVARTLRLLSLPAALGLIAALAVGCSGSSPTLPTDQPGIRPSFDVEASAPKKKNGGGWYFEDNSTLDGTCARGDLIAANGQASSYDTNGDGKVCRYR